MSRWGQFQEIADLPEHAFCENKYERTLEGGGGKGGSSSTSAEIPAWAQKAAQENIDYARQAAEIGYMPYYGPQMAAFNPTQLAGMQANIGAAEAFGLVPQGQLTAAQGMPAPTTYAGGFQGYGSGDLFDQAVAEFEARRPGQANAYNALFVDPYGRPESAATGNPLTGNYVTAEQWYANQGLPSGIYSFIDGGAQALEQYPFIFDQFGVEYLPSKPSLNIGGTDYYSQ